MDKSAELRQGVLILVLLAVLTGVEYWAAVGNLVAGMVVLGVIAIAKTLIILISFMHLGKLFQAEGGDH